MLGFGMGRNTQSGNTHNHTSYINGVSGHSPLPYLFGGVAAMLALIAVALLILACSFWKLSGHFGESGRVDGVSSCAEKKSEVSKEEEEENSEKKVVVIMAGDEEPSFLAKPAILMHHHDVDVVVVV